MRKSLEAISLIALAVLIWITWQALNGSSPLPDRIPTHFDAAGNPNGWGSPSPLWLLPVVAVALYLLITILTQFPKAFNYPVRLTAENRARLAALTLQMIAWLKVELVCLFAGIQWSIIDSIRQGEGKLSPALVPVFLVTVSRPSAGTLRPCSARREPDRAHRLAVAVPRRMVSASEQASQHQQNGGDGDTLVDKVFCLPMAPLPACGWWHRDGRGLEEGSHLWPAFQCLTARGTQSNLGGFYYLPA
jgi:hypothetical protein